MNKWCQPQILPITQLRSLKLTKWYNWVHFGVDITKKLDRVKLKLIKQKWKEKYPTTFWNFLFLRIFHSTQSVTRSPGWKWQPGADWITPVNAIRISRVLYLFTKPFRFEKIKRPNFEKELKKILKRTISFRRSFKLTLLSSFLFIVYTVVSVPFLALTPIFSTTWIVLLAAYLLSVILFLLSYTKMIFLTIWIRKTIINLPNEITDLFFPQDLCTKESDELLWKEDTYSLAENVRFDLMPTNKELWVYVINNLKDVLNSSELCSYVKAVSEWYAHFDYMQFIADENDIVSWAYSSYPTTLYDSDGDHFDS